MGSAGDIMTTATITFRKSDIIVAARDIQEPPWKESSPSTLPCGRVWYTSDIPDMRNESGPGGQSFCWFGLEPETSWLWPRPRWVSLRTWVRSGSSLNRNCPYVAPPCAYLVFVVNNQDSVTRQEWVYVAVPALRFFLQMWKLGDQEEPLSLSVFFFFLKIILLIYLFRLCWVFPAVWALSSSLAVRSEGYSLVQCMGFSLPWLVSLRSAGSMTCELHSCGTQHGFSCFVTCGTFQDQGSNLCLLRWLADSLPLCHQGSLHLCVFLFTRHQVFLIYLNISFNNTCLL